MQPGTRIMFVRYAEDGTATVQSWGVFPPDAPELASAYTSMVERFGEPDQQDVIAPEDTGDGGSRFSLRFW
ncbi:hypothetical protein ACIBCT_35245 [Streptosporangium sp. NPDC050855]|uniref:hypothetical protein n=1 Tax=Streptosporangium sp. NPDC050855 TaxID=3366194 RepID=UPI0037A4D48F